MVSREQILECLDILELKYTEFENNTVAISFSDETFFNHPVITFITIRDNSLVFHSEAQDYQPSGDLYALANRHNCRSYAPACYIDEDGHVVMERVFSLVNEVTPHYILEDVVRPSVLLPLQAFANFELSDEEIARRRASEE